MDTYVSEQQATSTFRVKVSKDMVSGYISMLKERWQIQTIVSQLPLLLDWTMFNLISLSQNLIGFLPCNLPMKPHHILPHPIHFDSRQHRQNVPPNTAIHLQDYTASQSRIPQFVYI
jgi:hypothetical protein